MTILIPAKLLRSTPRTIEISMPARSQMQHILDRLPWDRDLRISRWSCSAGHRPPAGAVAQHRRITYRQTSAWLRPVLAEDQGRCWCE